MRRSGRRFEDYQALPSPEALTILSKFLGLVSPG
jgi:hypothetical protein